MRASRCRLILALSAAGEAAALLPTPAMAAVPGTLGDHLPAVIANFTFAVAIVLLFIFGLYAYASLARFAPYHSWIYLYLVSLTGIAWSAFLLVSGSPPAMPVFVLTTVIGLNLIVHILRFDRIEIPSPFVAPPTAVPVE